jgi:hypothetical protein
MEKMPGGVVIVSTNGIKLVGSNPESVRFIGL